MRDFAAAVPWKVAARHWNLISSHDTARIKTVTGSASLTRIAAALLFTYLGTPMIFAGDEIGLEGTMARMRGVRCPGTGPSAGITRRSVPTGS